MTPIEKAADLFHKFMKPIDGLHKYPMCFDTAKQCALIAIEMFESSLTEDDIKEYWSEVKKQIEFI